MSASRPARWCETSEVPALGQSEIQVWKFNLASPSIGEVRPQIFLSAEERGQAARFHFAPDQRRFVVRRAVLRRLLAVCLEIKPEAVRISFSSPGKPAVAGQESSNGLRFSCSHSADLGLVAIARGIEIGVDLEQHRPLPAAEDLARTFFSNSEIRELAALPPSLKTTGFFNGWTRKEAFVKAIGLGLSFPLNRFSVTLTPGQPAALLDVAEDSEAVKKWTLAALDVSPDYSAALVFEGKNPRIKFFQWMESAPA
jgi:4'-phosphopantetheinyl transferase